MFLQDVPEGADGVSLGRKFQVGRNIHQHDAGIFLFQGPPQGNAAGAHQVHIQKGQLILFQFGDRLGFRRTGAHPDLDFDALGGKKGHRHLLNLFPEHRVVVANQKVHHIVFLDLLPAARSRGRRWISHFSLKIHNPRGVVKHLSPSVGFLPQTFLWHPGVNRATIAGNQTLPPPGGPAQHTQKGIPV